MQIADESPQEPPRKPLGMTASAAQLEPGAWKSLNLRSIVSNRVIQPQSSRNANENYAMPRQRGGFIFKSMHRDHPNQKKTELASQGSQDSIPQISQLNFRQNLVSNH